VFTLTINVDIN